MNFIRDRELARRFRISDVSEREQMLYVLLYVICVTLFLSSFAGHSMWHEGNLTIYDHLSDAAYLFFSVLTIFLCYRTNKRGDDCAFVARYFSIGFPVAVQTTLISVPVIITAYNLDIYLTNPGLIGTANSEEYMNATDDTGPLTVVATIVLSLYYLLRLNGSFKIAAGLKDKQVAFTKRDVSWQQPLPDTESAEPLLKRLSGNLLFGIRMSLFFPRRRGAFDITWHALWFPVLLLCILDIAVDFFNVNAPREFWYGGFDGIFFTFAALLLAAYLITVSYKQQRRTLALAVTVLNCVVMPFALISIFNALCDSLPILIRNAQACGLFTTLFYVWIYLAAFRAIVHVLGGDALRQLAGAGIIAASLCAPSYYIYFDDFWYGTSSDREKTPLDSMSDETLFMTQNALLESQVKSIKKSKPGRVDAYGIVAGSYGAQEVFRREVEFVGNTLAEHYGMKEKIITLLNNENTVEQVPLAIASNLKAALKELSLGMQKEDIVMLYMTSHGSVEEGLAVDLNYRMSFNKLDAQAIREALDESGIKNRVIIISSCFSGAMIDALKDDNTLIMTAAAADRTSFGCDDRLPMTYFADAYFKQALPLEKDLPKAFEKAKEIIAAREKAEGFEQGSNPQIYIGDNIRKALESYKPPPPEKGRD